MIIFQCEQCAQQSQRSFDHKLVPPADWIRLTINDLDRIVCCWKCGETLCRRMVANQEHPGEDVVHRRPPPRFDTADLDEGVHSNAKHEELSDHIPHSISYIAPRALPASGESNAADPKPDGLPPVHPAQGASIGPLEIVGAAAVAQPGTLVQQVIPPKPVVTTKAL